MTFNPPSRASATPRPLRASRLTQFAALFAAWIAGLGIVTSMAEDAEIANRRATERKAFSDAEIVDGFFKVTFGAELGVAGGVDRIRKYDGPIRVYVDNRANPDRSEQVGRVVADVRARIRDIDLTLTTRRSEANMVVSLVRDQDLARTIRSLYGIDRARRIQRSLEPQCLSGFRKDESFRILHSDVILVADAGEFVFYDCIYEELLQALGPINDDTTLPWSMFNDDVRMGFFDVFDQYILNILYDSRIRPGMTRREVQAVLPDILPSVRGWVAQINELPR
jgi:Protein of unknown function (DUF2927)